MKKIYFLTILSLSFYFLNAQDIIYTITGEINQQTTSIDSILVENISNNTRILFGDLPVLPDYNINLTQQSFWGATGIGTFKKDKGFFIKSNYPGTMVLACDYNRPLLTGISIFNTNGQKIYDFQKQEISAGSSINIHLDRAGLYVIKIMTPFGVQTFKAIGSSQQKNDNIFVNIAGQSGFMQGFKSTTVATNDGFSFSTGDSIRISIYKQNYYAYPAVLKITGSLSISFIFNKSSGTLTDPRDGQTYNLVTIGSQTWMAENLNYDTTNSWWYDNDSANGDIYGRLYTWDAALNACPSGWHLPSNDEWTILSDFLGGANIAGGKMKETGTAHWNSPNTGATNSSGFTALPGGYRDSSGSFYGLGYNGGLWSSTESGSNAGARSPNYNNAQVGRGYSYKTNGHSVRCLKGSGNTPPTALFTVSPSSGTTSTNFAFDASGSTDNEDPTSNLQVRWDFDGNGTWDTGWDTNKTTNHQYSSEGTYTTKLEVKDTKGLTGQYTKSITVSNASGTGTFTDPRDGQTYQTVKIGSQTWMAENLNYDTTNSWWYDNDSANGDIYGRLYTWDAALNACPSGWHLPSDDEWKTLEMALGMSQSEADNSFWRGTDEGGKMKEAGTAHWNSPNTGATNSSGFTALPGGYRGSDGSFYRLGYYGSWWSSTEYSGTHAWYRRLYYSYAQVRRLGYNETYGISVRCLKN